MYQDMRNDVAQREFVKIFVLCTCERKFEVCAVQRVTA